MNLDDFQRQVAMLFGHCPGCDDCNACRVSHLVEQVWLSGQRSGRVNADQNRGRKTYWHEWKWDAGMVESLVSHAIKVCPEWCFNGRVAAAVFTREQMERGEEWAKSGGHRKTDWVAFMKKWIRGEGEKMASGSNPPIRQADLFEANSGLPSGASPIDTYNQDPVLADAIRQNSR